MHESDFSLSLSFPFFIRFVLTVHPSIGLLDRDVVLKALHRLGRDLRVEIRHCHRRRTRPTSSIFLVVSQYIVARARHTKRLRASSAIRPPFPIIRALVQFRRHRHRLTATLPSRRSIDRQRREGREMKDSYRRPANCQTHTLDRQTRTSIQIAI